MVESFIAAITSRPSGLWLTRQAPPGIGTSQTWVPVAVKSLRYQAVPRRRRLCATEALCDFSYCFNVRLRPFSFGSEDSFQSVALRPGPVCDQSVKSGYSGSP